MKVLAPGKLLLAGAYAVLEGAPAVVVAVDRHAVADSSRPSSQPTPEVLAAMGSEEAPRVDASALRDQGEKLGLGSSAAMLVASLGVVAARKGKDLRSEAVRQRIFDEARRAHAAVQGGGSGVDIAASVYGGARSYALGKEAPRIATLTLPARLEVEVYWCGSPAVTSIMRARVDALKSRNVATYRLWIDGIASASRAFISACEASSLTGLLAAAREGAEALESLGQAADAPIVPAGLAPLVSLAASEGGAFFPSGAGGGDVFVHLGAGPSSPSFRAAALGAELRRITMSIDTEGLRTVA